MIIYEIANNHQGSVKLGKRIINEMFKVSEKNKVLNKSFVKFQFRDLSSFIHEKYEDSGNKHIKRFQDTRLHVEDFKEMILYAREKGLGVIATPFDEKSVIDCINLDIDYIKIASCSITDWSLIEQISKSELPIIISTGGHGITDIDNIVNYFEHRNNDIRLMHCVSTYPTISNEFNMDMIDKLKRRYPDIEIGYSGHEMPNELVPAVLAIGKGATIFERHVGIEKLNKYSMNPSEVDVWVNTIKYSIEACGSEEKTISKIEKDSIKSLQRGVYAVEPVKKGDRILKENVRFSMPILPGQISASDFCKDRAVIMASKDYNKDDFIFEIDNDTSIDKEALLRENVHKVKGFIKEAGIDISNIYTAELSHHFGLSSFNEYGATIINLINREYCKKLIVQLPGQSHPEHSHVQKEETFHILNGGMDIIVDGESKSLRKGDILTVLRKQVHSFSTDSGVIFEEISTTHIRGDSYYVDKSIANLRDEQRKTVVERL